MKKNILLTLGMLLMAVSGAFAQTYGLEEGFRTPPRSAKPYTWWHWMNGNISKEGVTADLEAMAAAGYGGVQCFNISIMTQGPVGYGSDEWYDITNHAIKECERLGLEFDMHNCPGWSSTGGMWITPEDAGKQVSWSYAFVKSVKPQPAKKGRKAKVEPKSGVDIVLRKPTEALDCYWDEAVIAYPSTKDEALIDECLVKATVDGNDVDPKLFSMNTADNTVRVAKEAVLELSREVSAQSLIGFIKGEPRAVDMQAIQSMRMGFGGGPSGPQVSVSFSKDGQTYTRPASVSLLPDAVSFASFKETFKWVKFTVSAPALFNGIQISGAPFNTGFLRGANYEMAVGGGGSGNGGFGGGGAPSAAVQIDPEYAIDPSTVIDISEYMDADGHLVWDAPEGDWTIIRIGYVPIDRHTKMGSTVGDGLEIDKYSRKALDAHWNGVFPRLMESYEKIGKAVKGGILIDSYEAGNCNWTPLMRQEFKQRRGYDMTAYLPAIVGKYVASEDVTTRFLWDFRRNCADMFADNYVGYYAELAHSHGLLIYNEPYNSSVFEEIQTGTRADIPMGEFWARTYQDRATIKMAASIAHVAGKRVDGQQIVGAESFSGWQQQAGYQGFPYAYKAEGDDMYTQGLNRFIFHRFVHQPNVYAKPGMSMGNIGSHIDANNTWFEKGKSWFSYIARTQFLLQQGNIVSDVLYLVSEDVPGSSHGTWNPALPFGYTGDAINAELLLGTVKIQGADLVAADDLHYKMLMIANGQGAGRTMTINVLRRIAEYVEAGGTVLGKAPVSTPNLSSEAELKEFAAIVDKLWGGIENGGVKNVGKGRVFNTAPQQALDALGIVPDVQYSFEEDAPVGFIHRKAQGADIFFLANHRRTVQDLVVTFRVDGRRPELWNSDTGEIIPLDIYEVLPDGRVKVDLKFDPAGSWFVIFREKAPAARYTSIALDGKEIISTAVAAERQQGGLYPDVKDNFTISVWLRPETNDGVDNNLGVNGAAMFSGNLASYPYILGDPEQLYGKGNAIAGIVASRFGVSIMQNGGIPANPAGEPRGRGGMMGFGFPGMGGSRAQAVASSVDKLASWNHIAAVYTDGVPQLYVNGELKATGKKATAIVHPAYKDVAYANDNHFFEGDFAEYTVYDHPLTGEEITAIVNKGVPAPELIAPAKYASDGGLLFFENGTYTARNASGATETIKVKGIPAPRDLTAAGWTVTFPEKLGAPAQIALDKLMPLQNHPDEGVKHFSGTATYKTTFKLSSKEIKGKQVFIDLGRVYVIASVRLNGKDLGVAWREPYMVDITSAAVAGTNTLEVEVANLWTNRLIGDAAVPNPYGVERGDSGIIPDWYLKNQPKPEDGRVAFSVVTFYDADEPLYDAGLVGPVVIRFATKQ